MKLAYAAGRDEANRRMTKAGRTKWNRADYNEAVRVINRLMDMSKPESH